MIFHPHLPTKSWQPQELCFSYWLWAFNPYSWFGLPWTTDEIRSIIITSPAKSCTLGPIPTTLLKECFQSPRRSSTVQVSGHTSGHTSALVRPIIKKPNLDPNVLGNATTGLYPILHLYPRFLNTPFSSFLNFCPNFTWMTCTLHCNQPIAAVTALKRPYYAYTTISLELSMMVMRHC